VSLEYILMLGGVLVAVVIVVWAYNQLTRTAAMALANSTEAILNQTIEEVVEWLRRF